MDQVVNCLTETAFEKISIIMSVTSSTVTELTMQQRCNGVNILLH